MTWSADLAYAIGLIVTDGSLSKDERHLNLTSKDLEQIKTFAKILHLKNKIGIKSSSFSLKGKYFQIQFGDIRFYRFLISIGLFPNKTKYIGKLQIPDRFFIDFLRGHLDGDGYTYSYWDKRWENSYMLYSNFLSASKIHLEWIQKTIKRLYNINGKINYAGKSVYKLIYAKKSSTILLSKIYYKSNLPYLKRKKDKINLALNTIKYAEVLKLVDRLA